MRIWDSKYETMPRAEIEQLQLERLQATVYRIHRHGVTFYRKKFSEMGIDPENIGSLKDLERLPFTTRHNLKESYPYDMFAVQLRDVVRVHEISGGLGIVGYTRTDLVNWSNLVARALYLSGIGESDTVQITHPYGLYPGALGYHYAAELIGASVIPSSTANTDKQLTILQDYRSTAIIATPSYAQRLASELREKHVDPKTLSMKHAVLGSEPWTEQIRKDIEEGLFVSATFNYGVASVFGPGVASECREKNGLHIFMDHFIPEIIDPHTEKTLPLGHEGELVLTTLTREAFPILRYRTGDITTLYFDKSICPCGRTHVKMRPVEKRVDDLFVFNGINLYPQQIEELLATRQGRSPRFSIVLTKKGNRDFMDILVEVSEDIFADEMKVQHEIIRDMEYQFQRRFELSASIKPVERGSLGKSKTVVDRRSTG
jgi:phenylacetate-CoA ligase